MNSGLPKWELMGVDVECMVGDPAVGTIVPPGTMSRLVGLIEQGLLKPLLAQTFPLRELARAQEAFMLKKHVGNIVVET